jgi:hypothetical protein
MGLFKFYGFSASPEELRALSQIEIQKAQCANYVKMENYIEPPGVYLAHMNAIRPHLTETRPLNERFADFKVRLAAAIDRRKLPH